MGDILLPDILSVNRIEEGLCLVAFEKPDEYGKDEFNRIVKEGAVIAVDDDKNLPVYPSMNDFILDVIESDFNPDIDRTLHFTSEDLNDIIVWKCKPLGDLRDTAHSTIKLAYAIMLMAPMNMEQIRADVKLAGAKYGKIIQYKEPDKFRHSDAASQILQGINTSNIPQIEDKKDEDNK